MSRAVHPGVRKFAFWGGVAVVSVLANFGVELASQKLPILGLKRFTAFTHQGSQS